MTTLAALKLLIGITPSSFAEAVPQVPPVTLFKTVPETVVFLIPPSAFNALDADAKLALFVDVLLSASHQFPDIEGILETKLFPDTTDKLFKSVFEIKPV